MSLSKLGAWQVLSGFALRSAVSPEDESAALEAIAAISTHLGLDGETIEVIRQCRDLQAANELRLVLRDFFSAGGQPE